MKHTIKEEEKKNEINFHRNTKSGQLNLFNSNYLLLLLLLLKLKLLRYRIEFKLNKGQTQSGFFIIFLLFLQIYEYREEKRNKKLKDLFYSH